MDNKKLLKLIAAYTDNDLKNAGNLIIDEMNELSEQILTALNPIHVLTKPFIVAALLNLADSFLKEDPQIKEAVESIRELTVSRNFIKYRMEK